MTRQVQFQPRPLATIAGYRRICDDLEAENDALKRELQALRADLARLSDAPPARRAAYLDFGAMAIARGGCGDEPASLHTGPRRAH